MGNVKQKRSKQTEPVTNTQQEPAPTATTPAKRGRKRLSEPQPEQEPGAAGAMLHNAIELAVSKQSKQIAEAMVRNTIKGNAAFSKLLTEITGAKNAPKDKASQKRKVVSLAELLLMKCSEPLDDSLEEQAGVPPSFQRVY